MTFRGRVRHEGGIFTPNRSQGRYQDPLKHHIRGSYEQVCSTHFLLRSASYIPVCDNTADVMRLVEREGQMVPPVFVHSLDTQRIVQVTCDGVFSMKIHGNCSRRRGKRKRAFDMTVQCQTGCRIPCRRVIHWIAQCQC